MIFGLTVVALTMGIITGYIIFIVNYGEKIEKLADKWEKELQDEKLAHKS